jgi:hypothetical protein
MEKNHSKPPDREFTCNGVTAAIWQNSVGNGPDRHTIRITKSFKDKKTGKRTRTDTLLPGDLPNVAYVADEAYKHLRLSSRESGGSSNGKVNANSSI